MNNNNRHDFIFVLVVEVFYVNLFPTIIHAGQHFSAEAELLHRQPLMH